MELVFSKNGGNPPKKVLKIGVQEWQKIEGNFSQLEQTITTIKTHFGIQDYNLQDIKSIHPATEKSPVLLANSKRTCIVTQVNLNDMSVKARTVTKCTPLLQKVIESTSAPVHGNSALTDNNNVQHNASHHSKKSRNIFVVPSIPSCSKIAPHNNNKKIIHKTQNVSNNETLYVPDTDYVPPTETDCLEIISECSKEIPESSFSSRRDTSSSKSTTTARKTISSTIPSSFTSETAPQVSKTASRSSTIAQSSIRDHSSSGEIKATSSTSVHGNSALTDNNKVQHNASHSNKSRNIFVVPSIPSCSKIAPHNNNKKIIHKTPNVSNNDILYIPDTDYVPPTETDCLEIISECSKEIPESSFSSRRDTPSSKSTTTARKTISSTIPSSFTSETAPQISKTASRSSTIAQINIGSPQEKEQITWSDDQTRSILEAICQYNIDQNGKPIVQNHMYQKLRLKLIEDGHFAEITTQQVQNKVRRLQRGYKNFMDDQSRTGNATKSIDFEDELHAAFGQKQDIVPRALLESHGGIKRGRAPDYDEEDIFSDRKRAKFQRKKPTVSDVLQNYTEGKQSIEEKKLKAYEERTSVLKDLMSFLSNQQK